MGRGRYFKLSLAGLITSETDKSTICSLRVQLLVLGEKQSRMTNLTQRPSLVM